MKFNITLTWSKLIALIIVVMSFVLDLRSSGSTATMYALPFVVVLITGKQVIDNRSITSYSKGKGTSVNG